MKFLSLFSLIMVAGVVAQAAGRQDVYNRICKNLSFESERIECSSIISQHEYFDDAALGLCTKLHFGDDKLQCVKAIAGKVYDNYEIENCTQASFDDDKVKCLSESGRYTDYSMPAPPPPNPNPGQPPFSPGCLNKPGFIAKLKDADRLVYDRRNNDARIVLNELITRLQRCPF